MLWDGTYGFSSLFEKTRMPNRLQMSLQRQHFLLSYLKTLRVGPAGVWARYLPLSRPLLSQLSYKPGEDSSLLLPKQILNNLINKRIVFFTIIFFLFENISSMKFYNANCSITWFGMTSSSLLIVSGAITRSINSLMNGNKINSRRGWLKNVSYWWINGQWKKRTRSLMT